MDSILTSIKKLLGIEESYEHFDTDIIIHINSAFSDLTQLGVGPAEGFRISDSYATWKDFTKDEIKLESVKDLVYLKVRLIFDPPSSSYVLTAFENRIKELEWRLNVAAESITKESEV